MSPRARVYTFVGLIAAVAAGGVVTITALTATHPPRARAGQPPFAADWTASPELSADVHAAVGSVPRLTKLADANPRSSFVRLNLGLAYFWKRQDDAAVASWQQAKRLQPDTPSAVRAGDFLHPNSPSGLPKFELTSARAPTGAQRLLIRGVRFQYQGRPLSAERLFAHAAALAPNNADAQVAAAVGLYDKDKPSLAFKRLGPLLRRFPKAPVVRFHLGLLSIWIGAFKTARQEFQLALDDNQNGRFARPARTLLARLKDVPAQG